MGTWAELWRSVWSTGPLQPDGFGQSWADDVRFLYRFWQCWNRPVGWREPSDAERQCFDAHEIIGRFGDFTEKLAEVDGRSWVVRSRAFWGWPDPPQWVLFVVEPDGTIWCAADFNQWPGRWKRGEPGTTKED